MKACPFCAEEIQDAAIKCKHCGSDLAQRPPANASSPPAKKGTSIGTKVFAWAGGILALFIVIGLIQGGSGPSTSSRQTETLTASVSFDGAEFTIKNTGADSWSNVKAEINGVVNGYELKIDDIAGHGQVTVRARDFAKRDGSRFVPTVMKPQEFYIYADVQGGTKGVWQGGWK